MIEAKNIYKTFLSGKKELSILKEVNLFVKPGEFVAIVGPSGAGKSTLLHILGGLDTPSKGDVFFDRENLFALSEKSLARIRNERVGFVFQFYHLLPEFTVLENCLMPVLIGPSRSGAFKERENFARSTLERLGLGQRLGHFPSQLSGGEKQRVAIVRALMNKPSLLLCDEPTGNLDSNNGREITLLLKEINAAEKVTVVLVTHNAELSNSADKIFYLKDGIIVN